jgi:hypothetical protein
MSGDVSPVYCGAKAPRRLKPALRTLAILMFGLECVIGKVGGRVEWGQIGFVWKYTCGAGRGWPGAFPSEAWGYLGLGTLLVGLNGFGGTEFKEVVEGSGVLAIQGSLVALEKVERLRGVGQAAEGHGGKDGIVAGLRVLTGGFDLERDCLHGPVANQAPARDSHGLDEGTLSGGVGLEFLYEGCAELFEAVACFGFQNDAVEGEKAVARGVLRDCLLACERDWPGGAFGVGAVGLKLTVGCHKCFSV